ncbi:MAG: RecQ family ATP-dependent DNA helicase [Bacteroidales bacterium]
MNTEIIHNILKTHWGYDSFRPLQEEIVERVLDNKDTLALMPTGGGKSITFQVPTLAREGVCLVITPLIALMKDQVDNLRKRGIKATAIYSGMSLGEMNVAINNCLWGNYKFLYVSPERLSTSMFLDYVNRINFSLIAVDEAHCISQWGYDFRPSYLTIADIRKVLPNVPILALTATATPMVVEDIQAKLLFTDGAVLKKSSIRVNLSYVVRNTTDKMNELIHILTKVGGCGIVYVRNRIKTKEIAEALRIAGIDANYYHAGLKRKDKELRQTAWTKDQCRIMVSTNAFGMGIDKPDVRIVVHFDAPDSLEEYFQEAGRAGRDEKKAYAVFLFNPHDASIIRRRITTQYPPKEFIRSVYDLLGTFFQLAVHTGKDRTFNFSLEKFCLHNRLSFLQTHHALTILSRAGYIQYEEEPNNSPRLIFTVVREELYKLHTLKPQAENLIQWILRSYTGVFTDYASMDEEYLSSQTGLSLQQIYEILLYLDKQKVISYISKSNSPMITYIRQREDSKYVQIPREVYEMRLDQYEKRVEKVIEYLTTDDVCRSRMLVTYFGENASSDCGICDVCIRRKKVNENPIPLTRVIVQLLKEKPRSADELTSAISSNREEVHNALRILLDQGVITINESQILCVVSNAN